jgi:hypothetical protein
MIKTFLYCLFILQLQMMALLGQAFNQTPTTTPILPSDSLPFEVSIDLMDLSLPNGWHSGAMGIWKSKCLLVAGRTNGMHGFSEDPLVNNFPPSAQNTVLFVIDFKHGTVWQRSLTDPSSGLTQEQIDTLSVTSPQFYQNDRTLYMNGGYGIDSSTGTMDTKSTLTAMDVPKLIGWVTEPGENNSVIQNIRQTTHPLLQVTGGYMNQNGPQDPTLLIFGQNFTGLYRDGSNGDYTEQVRTFRIIDDGSTLSIEPSAEQPGTNPSFRRRDLNVVPVIRPGKEHHIPAYVALSGVFTENGGIWTVPVVIAPDGSSFMADPQDPATFKQGMNNYASPTIGLYSEKREEMYIIIPGGITFGYFQKGVFKTDNEIPFTNEVTTIKLEHNNTFSQYIMNGQYPKILSQFSNPGKKLLFGAGAEFFPRPHLSQYSNGVLKLDHLLDEPHVVGFIIGGIQSTLPNTNTTFDSAASPYIFKVTLQPRKS